MAETSKIGSGRIQIDEKNNRITIAGTSTALEWEKIVEAKEKVDRRPADRLISQADSMRLTTAAMRDLRSKIERVHAIIEKLYAPPSFDRDKSLFDAKMVRVISDDPMEAQSPRLLVSVKNVANPGSYDIRIQELATSFKISSLPILNIRRDEPAGFEGDFVLWSPHRRDNTFAFEVEPHHSLNDIVLGVNELGAGVVSKIISPRQKENYFLLQSLETGEEHAFQFALWSSANLLEKQLMLARLDNTTHAYIPFQVNQEARDARLIFDDIEVRSPSNVIQDLVDGLTVQLLRVSGDRPSTLLIEPNVIKIGNTIEGLIKHYNELVVFLNQQTEADSLTREPKPNAHLFGQAIVAEVRRVLSNVFVGMERLNTDQSDLSRSSPIQLRLGTQYQGTDDYGTAEVDWDMVSTLLTKNLDGFKKAVSFQFSANDRDLGIVSLTEETQEKPKISVIDEDGHAEVKSPFELYVELERPGVLSNATRWSDGNLEIQRQTIKVTSGAAKGLQMVYAGQRNGTTIEVDYSLGAMTPAYFSFNRVLERENGVLALALKEMETKITSNTDKSKVINQRASDRKSRLVKQYTEMERKLSLAEKSQMTLDQANEAWLNSRK